MAESVAPAQTLHKNPDQLLKTAPFIVCADDGPGISPANRTHIFDPFFTTHRAAGGTGMGLSIARAMVETHRGSLDLVDSVRGAAFLIDLPVGGTSPDKILDCS
ncbi:ATP-binding protein [Pleomorphomonas sp. PLEO]|uniref:ATP-binding protein n=1 Tax=Pleomorphomonas sp. PLEO TaxID=3239306 RepID=UPI00351E4CEE